MWSTVLDTVLAQGVYLNCLNLVWRAEEQRESFQAGTSMVELPVMRVWCVGGIKRFAWVEHAVGSECVWGMRGGKESWMGSDHIGP